MSENTASVSQDGVKVAQNATEAGALRASAMGGQELRESAQRASKGGDTHDGLYDAVSKRLSTMRVTDEVTQVAATVTIPPACPPVPETEKAPKPTKSEPSASAAESKQSAMRDQAYKDESKTEELRTKNSGADKEALAWSTAKGVVKGVLKPLDLIVEHPWYTLGAATAAVGIGGAALAVGVPVAAVSGVVGALGWAAGLVGFYSLAKGLKNLKDAYTKGDAELAEKGGEDIGMAVPFGSFGIASRIEKVAAKLMSPFVRVANFGRVLGRSLQAERVIPEVRVITSAERVATSSAVNENIANIFKELKKVESSINKTSSQAKIDKLRVKAEQIAANIHRLARRNHSREALDTLHDANEILGNIGATRRNVP